MEMLNNVIKSVELTIALVNKFGVCDTEWLAEWYPEMFQYPCEAWKVEEHMHSFETMEEVLDYYDVEDEEELYETVMVFYDEGLTQIIVME